MNSEIVRVRAALNEDPESQPLRMKLARTLIDDAWSDYSHDKWSANYREARSIYESILTACPHNAVALVNLGMVLSDQGHHEQAMKQYSLAQELGWEDANLEFNIGVVLVNLQDDQRGAQHMKAAIEKPKHTDTLRAYFDPQAH